MGNRNANEQNDDNIIRENEQILIQNDANNQISKIDPPSVKKIFAVRNPFSIKKTSLILEKDAGPANLFYIKFEYDSVYNFNCYINFEVSKNPLKGLRIGICPNPCIRVKKNFNKKFAEGGGHGIF